MVDDISPALEKYRETLMPKVAAKLKCIRLDDYPIHISSETISRFTPRIPASCSTDEDKYTPRVCCSISLSRALYGARWNFCGSVPDSEYHIYTLPELDVLEPSVALTDEPKRGNEVWVVPHRMSNWDIRPTKVGSFRVSEIKRYDWEEKNKLRKLVLVGFVSSRIRWNADKYLEPGKTYQIEIKINDNDVDKLIVGDIDECERFVYDQAGTSINLVL